MSQEYLGALVIVLVGLFKLFKIDVAPEFVTSAIIVVTGLYVAYRRHQKGDITMGGIRK